MSQFDFVGFGDITTDAFIEMKGGNVEIICDTHGRKCRLCVNFGDKIPYERVDVVKAVGNAPNASTSAHRLGLRSAIATNLGDDENGQDCLATLKKEGVSTALVKVHKGLSTNYHYVLRYEEERTILIKHQTYKYTMPKIGEPKWLYFSSLGENSVPFHHTLMRYLEKHPKINLTFQPGSFQIKLGYDKLKRVYKRAQLFFCNVQEAQRILKTKKTDIKFLLKKMQGLGPQVAVVTDGPQGAYAYNGSVGYFMPIYPDQKPPVDRTGCGDSFASSFTTAMSLGKSLEEALLWAPINPMSVIQYVGAQKGLLSRAKLLQLLKKAPKHYKPKKII